MPQYYYECEFCDHELEEFRPIKDGPRQDIICPVCDEQMIHQMSCNFILKGDGWPSKEFRDDNTLGEMADKAEVFVSDHDSKKKNANEVLGHRRKGHKHFNEWKRHNKPKVKQYWKNKTEGYKGRNA